MLTTLAFTYGKISAMQYCQRVLKLVNTVTNYYPDAKCNYYPDTNCDERFFY